MSKKMGRPQKEINQDQFEKLCAMFCKRNEIVSFFDVSEDTLERWAKRTYGETFAVVYNKKCDGGRISLRRAMLQNALSGNVTMQIWLSKQYLGMSDNILMGDDSLKEIEVRITKHVKTDN